MFFFDTHTLDGSVDWVALQGFQRDIGYDVAQADVLWIEFAGSTLLRKYIVRELSTAYQQRVDTQVQIAFLLNGIFRGKSVEYKLEVGFVLGGCTLLIDILPLNRGRISNLAERRVTFSISFPDWSFSSKSSMMIRFNNPMSIRPMVSLLPSMEASSLATSTDIWRWT